MIGTDPALVGKKVHIVRAGRRLLVTIKKLDSTNPRTAYTITWTKEDNPEEDIPADSGGMYSVIHHSLVSVKPRMMRTKKRMIRTKMRRTRR